MVKETALMAMSNGSSALTKGELARADEETPNNEASGLAQTPIQAPPLQQESNIGSAELKPPPKLVHIVFFVLILMFSFKNFKS